MTVSCTERSKNLIVSIQGEIDHHTADSLRETIERAFSASQAKNIVFDFAGVTFMDSSGIGMIIGRYRHLEKLGGRVYAINVSSLIDRVFEVSGLKKIVPCFADIEEAR